VAEELGLEEFLDLRVHNHRAPPRQLTVFVLMFPVNKELWSRLDFDCKTYFSPRLTL